MTVHAIVAMSSNRVIGKNNQLPWHLPADLAHFKKLTMGKPILMGRKTFQSIGKPLPGRRNIILTRDKNFHADNCIVAFSFEDALNQCKDCEDIFIIGGAQIFTELMPKIDVINLTLIHHTFPGDAFFPELDPTIWHETQRIEYAQDEKNLYAMSFLTFAKNKEIEKKHSQNLR